MHIISLGAGVQSSTIALMAAKGEIGPMPTAAIFSDTQAEPKSIYAWLDWLEKQLPFPVYRVTAGSLTTKSLSRHINKKTGGVYVKNMIPAFVRHPDGTKGIVGRACTYDHKIIPILKKVRQLCGNARKGDEVRAVQWIGISLDEVSRMKPSRETWSKHRWPLIEMEMSRHDCLRWMERNGYPKPPRSACIYCPFHSDHEWRRLKNEEPEAFQEAVRFEKALQALHGDVTIGNRMVNVPYLHDSLRPIDEINFSDDPTQGQLKFGNECEGLCGV